jgi:Flp pilus assembly protein TadD
LSNPLLPALAAAILLGSGLSAAPPEDVRYLMLKARAMQRSGGGDNPEGAVAIYRKVVAQQPGSAQGQLRLSEALMETGDLQGAVAPAVKATKLDAGNYEVWAHLGLLYYIQSHSNETLKAPAADALRHAVKLWPWAPELWTRCAEMEEGSQDLEGALKSWLSVGRLHPTIIYQNRVLADYAWERAMELAKNLKHYEARREAVLALCAGPNVDNRHLRFLEELVQEQLDQKFLGHAEESFAILAKYLPKDPFIWKNIAIIQLRTNRFEAALISLDKAEKLGQSTDLSYHIGYCLMKLGRVKEAETRWQALLPALGKDPDDLRLIPAVKAEYATCLLLQGRPKEMLDLIAPWPEAESDPELVALRAQAQIQTEQWKAACRTLRDGLAKFPGKDALQGARDLPPGSLDEHLFFSKASRQALTQLNLETMAGLWAEFHDWEHCLSLTREARKALPAKGIELLLLESNALDSLGRTDEAVAVLREGQKLNPNHPTVQNNLGFLLLEKGGDLAEATRLIEASLAQEPKNTSTMDSWGWALYKNGRFKESEEVLRKAAGLSPYSPEVHRHLGEALLKLNRPGDALDEWDRALAYSFPDRKVLEDQARELRTRLAKAQQSKDDTAPEEPAETGDEEGGEGEP